MVIKKIAVAAASAMLVATIVFAASARPVYAADKVDCDAVMNELNSGKHAKDVATDLSISTSSVYRCKRKAKAAAKAATKTSLQAQTGKEVPVPPMASAAAAASPAMSR
jgi:hypothetical protein